MFIRRLPKFEYHAPTSVQEALQYLSEYGARAKVLAGGTDLLISMKKRDEVPEHLVNLKGIEGLKTITYEKRQGLKIGGLATIGDIERQKIIQDKFTMLWDAVNVMAAPQVRNLGTIGGNLCSAAPSADTVPPLIAYGASVKVVGNKGERSVLVEHFFRGPAESVLEPDEILTEIFIPEPPERSGGAYMKLMRRKAMDLAQVGVAVFLRLDDSKKRCEETRIALGAVAPTPIRAHKAEGVLAGKEINEDAAEKAGQLASQEAQPITDIRATEEYRRSMSGVLTRRATLAALRRIV